MSPLRLPSHFRLLSTLTRYSPQIDGIAAWGAVGFLRTE